MHADTADLQGIQDNSVVSLPSLHAVEHFGLTCYGNPVEPDACFRAMCAPARVLLPGVRLYFPVPIGVERIEFSDHRVFAPETIMPVMWDLRMLSFAAVADDGHFSPDPMTGMYHTSNVACGMFEFTK